MRPVGLSLLMLASLASSSCLESLRSQQPSPEKWTTGFWFWRGSATAARPPDPAPDTLYFQAGELNGPNIFNGNQPWHLYGEIPNPIPAAGEYWMVFRFDRQSVPDTSAIPVLTNETARLLKVARERGLNLVGIQLDIDSPTASLPQYSAFLHSVRQQLPPGMQLSITGLLDWFRDDTSVTEVIREVDEFVPQFYDLGDPGSRQRPVIAAKFDAGRWGPVFNRFGKRFRIGISTFGRARIIRLPGSSGMQSMIFNDLTPMDIAVNPAFTLQTSKNETSEMVLNYRAIREVRIGWNTIRAGEIVQFILPTPEQVRLAVTGARHIGGSCAGVLFFRWPEYDEALAMAPAQVMSIVNSDAKQSRPEVMTVDGECASVKCMDVFVVNGVTLNPNPVRYRLKASTELEYFIPNPRIPARMTGSSQLELSLPPWSGRQRIHLGRAVSAMAATYTMETEQ